MKILIIGLGYAGTRFLHAFQSANISEGGENDVIAYVGRTHRRTDLPYFSDVPSALAEFQPHLVVLSVNDVYRADVASHLAGYKGFVLCEKPFICPSDDLSTMADHFAGSSGFCLDLIERYAPTSIGLRELVQREGLRMIRANFTWGKDRLGDHRPTCGVTSEIIHALDLVQHVSGLRDVYHVISAHGVRSDFSVSGPEVPDSISVLAQLGSTPVTGYASFVNVSRRREIGFIFGRPAGGLVFANMIFDDPAWDDDYLRVWEIPFSGERILLEQRNQPELSPSGHLGISKLVRVASDIRSFIKYGNEPSIPFADISTTISLQQTLNAIHQAAERCPVVSFTQYGPIAITTEPGDWERLG